MLNIFNPINELSKTFLWEVCIALGIIASYATSRYLMLPLLLVVCLYIIGVDSDDKSTAMLLAMLLFSGVFKISSGSTSLFFVCKIAYLGRAFVKGYIIRVRKPVIFEAIFILICILNMTLCGTDATIRIINLFLWMLVAYVMIFNMTYNKYQIEAFFVISFFISCLVALTANFIPALALEIKNVDIYYDSGYGADISRYTGIFGDPNMTTVIIIICMFIILKIYQAEKLNSIVFLGGAVLLSVLGIMTGSKSCFLLLIVFWVVYFFTKVDNKFLKVVLVMAAVAIVFSFSTTNLYEFYMYRFFGAASGITTGRTDIWATYFDSINSHGLKSWILGLGINTANLPNGRAAHNVFIQIIYNIGIVGLVSYLMFWISVVNEYIKPYKGTKSLHLLNWVPLICIIATAVFLDAFFIELYYFALPLAIILISPVNDLEGAMVNE